MIIKLDQFRGLAPRIAAVDLPQPAAQTALNCLFGSGALRPIASHGSVTVTDTLVTGTKQAIYKYTSDHWLAWINDVNVCKSSIALDAYDRLYWTGDGAPKMGGNTVILSGTSKPGGSWPLGISKPPTAITATGTESTSVEAVTYSYVYTYVSIFGEEGPPSTPSAAKTIMPGTEMYLSGMTVPGGQIASINIYRANTGTDATAFQFLVNRTVSTGFTESTLSSALGEVLPSATWIAPNSSMKGLISHPGGFLVGHYNNVLCPSEPYMPHAYPADYQVTVDAEIVATGAFGNSILVTTKGMPYVLSGTSPGQLSIEKLEKGESCILKRGFVDMGDFCIYPGPSGLWIAGTGNVALATESLMTKKEWSAYSSTMVFALQYGTQYIGFSASGGFVFDTATGDLAPHDVVATGGWYERETGKLFLVVGGLIKEWAAGSDKSLVWKSKKFQLSAPSNIGAGRVFAAGPVTIKVYADGTLKHTQSQAVTSSEPFRLPGGYLATNWEVQIEGAYEVTSVLLASSITELAQA